jgi:hypothetical protein
MDVKNEVPRASHGLDFVQTQSEATSTSYRPNLENNERVVLILQLLFGWHSDFSHMRRDSNCTQGVASFKG